MASTTKGYWTDLQWLAELDEVSEYDAYNRVGCGIHAVLSRADTGGTVIIVRTSTRRGGGMVSRGYPLYICIYPNR